MRLTDYLPKWIAVPLRLLPYALVMFVLFKISLSVVQGRLMNNAVECAGTISSPQRGSQYVKSLVACLRDRNSYFENLLMKPVYSVVDAIPNAPKELVGVWEASQPRCTYRHTLKENGEFISEPVECILSDETFHGVWGVYDNQMVWLSDDGKIWPPDINPIDKVDQDFFLLVEQDGSRTKFSRLKNIAVAPAENARAEESAKEGAPDAETGNTDKAAMTGSPWFLPKPAGESRIALRSQKDGFPGTGTENTDKVAITGDQVVPSGPPSDPQTAQEWMTRGHWYLHESGLSGGDKNKARAAAASAFTKVIEAQPDNANAWFNRGLANGGSNDINRAIELDPDRFHFLMTRGASFSLGSPQTAVADLRKALALDPVLWGMYWRWAGQQTSRAVDDYIEAIMREPENRGIYFNPYTFGPFGEKEAEYRRWVNNLTNLIARNSRKAEFYDSLGNAYFKHGAYTDALAAFSKMVELTRSGDAYHSRGIVYTAMEQWDNAKSDLETALAKGNIYARPDLDWLLFLTTPDGAERWVNYGHALGGYVPSVVAYTRALEFDPKNIAALRGRAEASSESEMPDQAIEDYSALLLLDPANAKETLFRRGKIYGMTGKLENAINDWEAAAGLGNEEAKQQAANALAGFVTTIMGWYEGDGSEEPWLGADGKPLSEQEKLQKAIEALNRALKIFPNNPASLHMRAALYAQAGENRLALDDFSEAIRLAPQNSEAYLGRAAIYRAMKDEERAIADWKKAAELGNEDASWLLQENGASSAP